MANREGQITPAGKNGGAAIGQLVLQVVPLKQKLSVIDRDGLYWANRPNLRCIKVVAALRCFGVNGCEIEIDCEPRLLVYFEPFQLRMICVAASLSAKHCLGEQRFAPQGDKALWIEIFGVQ